MTRVLFKACVYDFSYRGGGEGYYDGKCDLAELLSLMSKYVDAGHRSEAACDLRKFLAEHCEGADEIVNSDNFNYFSEAMKKLAGRKMASFGSEQVQVVLAPLVKKDGESNKTAHRRVNREADELLESIITRYGPDESDYDEDDWNDD